jgi:Tol biopolymer transport system component
MKLPRLNQKGITHILALIAFIGIFAVIGGLYLHFSHAAPVATGGGGGSSSTPSYYNGDIYTGGSIVWWDSSSPYTLSPPSGFAAQFSNASLNGFNVAYFTSPSYSKIYEGTFTGNSNAGGTPTVSLSNIRNISTLPSGTLPFTPPIWSPDGTKLAEVTYSSTADPKTTYSNQIWIARTDGSPGHVVPNIPTDIEPYVSWRPGSVNLTYVEPHPQTGNQICTISTGGANKSCHSIPRGTVKFNGYLGEGGLAVSPTGGQVALVAFNYSTTGTVISSDIYTVNSDGSGLKRLSTLPAGEQADAVVWSPDGTKIAYLLDDNGTSNTKNATGLFVMNAVDGSGKTQIAGSNFFNPPSLSWSEATGK